MTEIKCQMAGVVAELLVEPGQAVAAGQTVGHIESMKMLVEVKAETAGTVVEISAQVGDFVQEGDILAIMA